MPEESSASQTVDSGGDVPIDRTEQDRKNARRDLISLLTLGFGFTLLFTAFQTGSQVSELVFRSYDHEHGTSINAYTGNFLIFCSNQNYKSQLFTFSLIKLCAH